MDAENTPPGDTLTGRSARGEDRNGRRYKTEPTCPLPPDRPHNSVRAARAGCTCPDGVAALGRERDRDRSKKHRRHLARAAARHAEPHTEQTPKPPQPRPRRAPARGPGLTHQAGELERALWRRDDLACRDEDPDLFVPLGDGPLAREQVAVAKAVCGSCPAMTSCLAVSLRIGDDWSVRGGTTPDERRALRAAGWAA